MQSDCPTRVSPDLDRPGLEQSPPPELAFHLLAGVWVASCPLCGCQIVTARSQATCERRALGRRCPVCWEGRT
jgi:hypothetical protein